MQWCKNCVYQGTSFYADPCCRCNTNIIINKIPTQFKPKEDSVMKGKSMKNYREEEECFLPVKVLGSGLIDDSVTVRYQTGFNDASAKNTLLVADLPNILLRAESIVQRYEEKYPKSTVTTTKESEIPIINNIHLKTISCGSCGRRISQELWNGHACIETSSILVDKTKPKFCPNCGKKIIYEEDYEAYEANDNSDSCG
jgi:hypothetical protein